jgi:hypothetical protein
VLRPAVPADQDDLVARILADALSARVEWILEPAPNRDQARRLFVEFEVRLFLSTGGGVLDDDGDFVLWEETQRNPDFLGALYEGGELVHGRKVGSLHYPDLPDTCLQRLYALGKSRRPLKVDRLLGSRRSGLGLTLVSETTVVPLLEQWLILAGRKDLAPMAVTDDSLPALNRGLHELGLAPFAATNPPPGAPAEQLWLRADFTPLPKRRWMRLPM